jgi:sugar lactone lactonase YvrE
MNPRRRSSKSLAPSALRISCALMFWVALGRPASGQQPAYTPYTFTTLAGAAMQSGYVDGAGGAARFYGPEGVALDEAGNIYVADFFNKAIRKVTAAGIVSTLMGTQALLKGPEGVAVDAAGNLYIADSSNNTILKITMEGTISILAGANGATGSADGAGSVARFSSPSGLAVDGSGNVYVADSGNNTVRKITPAGVVTTIAGTAGVTGGADGTGGAAQFNLPRGVAVDGAGNVYVADQSNSAIRKISAGGVVTTLAGSPWNDISYSMVGIRGSTDGPGSVALFSNPGGVAVDAGGNLFVTDTGNSTIRRISPTGVVTTLAGIPGLEGSVDGTGPAAQFTGVFGIAVDAKGTLYVSDGGTIRIGHPTAPQAPATVTLGGLYQNYDGTPKHVSGATDPAGLATVVLYDNVYAEGQSLAAPVGVGSYPIYAVITDPGYSGYAIGTITIGPGLSAQTSFTVQTSSPGGSFLRSIAAGPAGLVSVGDSGAILTSGDGVTWSRRASGTTNSLYGVAFGGGQYVAVGDNGCVLLSSDGAAWSGVARPATAARLNNVIYAAGQFVAVGDEGAVISSRDGRTWTASRSGVTGWLRGLAYTKETDAWWFVGMGTVEGSIPARFVAAGQGGAVITSTDGVNWGPLSEEFAIDQSSGKDIEALVANKNSYFSAINADGSLLTEADDDGSPPYGYALYADSSVASSLPGIQFSGLIEGPNGPYMTGENGTIETNPYDIGPWVELPTGTTANLVGGVFVGDSLFVVGENETIVRSVARPDSRLVNLSCRTQVGTGANILIAGFVVGGTGASAPLLIRGSGPALIPFGISGTLPDPKLQLFSTLGEGSLLATNDGWGGSSAISSAAAATGAFAWADASSRDAALLETLAPGAYTANLSGSSGDSGVALAEIYDATPDGTATATSPRLINISARSEVGSGANSLIVGFVIGGSTPKTVLIRASGPALAPFGVSGTLSDPELQVHSTASGSTLVASNTGWGGDAQIATAAAWVGAFSWGSSATPDSALLVTLLPGPYTANVTGASGDTGLALIEVYEVQ